MRERVLCLVLCLILAAAVAPAAAQGRGPVPDRGMAALGGSIGASIPTDDRLDNGLSVAGTVEGYFTPRVSIRGQLGGTWQDLKSGQAFSGTIKPLWIDGNIVYNWEGGAWHPYVTAGIGWYRYNFEERSSGGTFTGNDNAVGFDVGGGIEYFFTRHATFTGEALYHRVGEVITTLVPFSDHTGFWTISLGMKKYF
jgi:Outer membrane protein beta-barrel domain